MRNTLKKFITMFTAGALVATAGSCLAACDGNFRHPTGIPSGSVQSNGGFAVEAGEYIYFINGVETYESDNTYGKPVKGALMRISKNSLAENKAETVIPSLATAGDYTSGIFIYGDRIYYATPNNVKNTSGNIERNYLDFKSAKLDGSDIQSYFNVSRNNTPYRFVEAGGTVYLVYTENNTVYSYNTAKKVKTTLAENVGESFFSSTDKEDPYVYYTMSVTLDIDVVGGSMQRAYNQIYRVRADATECPYAELRDYEWNKEYLDENDGKAPYLNLGELVLDGIGSVYKENPTIFSHEISTADPLTTVGYTYDLQDYANGGLYFTRKDLTTTGTVGEDGWLYYLSAEKLSSGWNSISGNARENLEVVAQPNDLKYANNDAIFYRDNGKHSYLYVSDSNILRAEVDEAGVASVTRIAQGASGANLVSIDRTDSTYHYVYYTLSGGGGNTVWRAVFNGTEENYKSLGYDANEPYRPVQILNIEHAKAWYNFELIGGKLFFADAESLGSTTYNYIAYVDLLDSDGTVKDNAELARYKETMDEIVGTDGYFSKLSKEDKKNLSTAMRYHYYTGEIELFYSNIEEAEKETAQKNTLYSAEEVKEFEEYLKNSPKLRSNFIHEIGIRAELDEKSIDDFWQITLEHYTAPAEEEANKLPVWAWVLIGLGGFLLLASLATLLVLVLRTRKQGEIAEEEKMFVDTTDDRSVDVYADEPITTESEAEEPAAEAEEATEPAEAEEPASEAQKDAEAVLEPSETPEA